MGLPGAAALEDRSLPPTLAYSLILRNVLEKTPMMCMNVCSSNRSLTLPQSQPLSSKSQEQAASPSLPGAELICSFVTRGQPLADSYHSRASKAPVDCTEMAPKNGPQK